MIIVLARAIGGALLLPTLPVLALVWVWTTVSPPMRRRVFGRVDHRYPPFRAAHDARKRFRTWRAER